MEAGKPIQNPEGKLALYEEELYKECEREKEPVQQFVVFGLGGEYYGVDIQDVSEVVATPFISPLPNVPRHVAGIFSLRGNIVPVTDLRTLFGLSAVSEEGKYHIVVINHENCSTGLFVEVSEGAIKIPVSKIAPPVATLDEGKGELIEGQVKWEDKLIAILSAQKIIEKTRLGSS